MATKNRTRHLILSLLLAFSLSLASLPSSASAASASASIPDLARFTASVVNGNSRLPRSVTAPGIFAFPVVQQVYSAQVSEVDHTVTQYAWAAKYGVVGLLAHNYLSGQYFFRLRVGQKIYLVFSDGRLETYTVTHIYRYQATIPRSIYSGFIDLRTGESLSAEGLFSKVYMGPKHLTLQTCIEKDGELSWGRLFVIAEPTPFPSRALRN